MFHHFDAFGRQLIGHGFSLMFNLNVACFGERVIKICKNILHLGIRKDFLFHQHTTWSYLCLLQEQLQAVQEALGRQKAEMKKHMVNVFEKKDLELFDNWQTTHT